MHAFFILIFEPNEFMNAAIELFQVGVRKTIKGQDIISKDDSSRLRDETSLPWLELIV